ncbi:MAG: hypothetical protein IPH52_08535 [Leptospiraceae bacterium]|nr:hypothetical protein [Leptospiraceae bacterium]
MVRQILTPWSNVVTLNLPDSFIGKTIEILAFDIYEKENSSTQDLKKEIEIFYNSIKINMKGFKFNREEINERE